MGLRVAGRSVTRMIFGMMSLALTTQTESPMATSRRSISSKLARDALLTVVPPISTGRSCAVGYSPPVCPPLISTPSSTVSAPLESNFHATCPLGLPAVKPSSRWSAMSSSFITTPSIQIGSALRVVAMSWK